MLLDSVDVLLLFESLVQLVLAGLAGGHTSIISPSKFRLLMLSAGQEHIHIITSQFLFSMNSVSYGTAT